MRRRGELAEALSAAAAHGPGPVAALAARAQVGYSVARYTASRMVARGELVKVSDDRPALLALPTPEDDSPPGQSLSFWESWPG